MKNHYSRTTLGVEEIRSPKHKLTRPQRNLLLIVNEYQPIDHWLSQVKGIDNDSVTVLVTLGLLAVAEQDTSFQWKEHSAKRLQAKSLEQDPIVVKTMNHITSQPFESLYELLVEQAHQRWGNDRGHQFELELQNCETDEELHRIAKSFVLQVARTASKEQFQSLSDRLLPHTPDNK